MYLFAPSDTLSYIIYKLDIEISDFSDKYFSIIKKEIQIFQINILEYPLINLHLHKTNPKTHIVARHSGQKYLKHLADEIAFTCPV